MVTLEQERAAFALKQVEAVAGDGRRAKYKTQLLKLPARLHNNGLGQTAAFLLAQKKGSPEHAVYDWLQQWLGGKPKIYDADQSLIKCITGEGMTDDEAESGYRRASAEVRSLAVWLKRFAEAFLEGEAE